VSLGAVRSVRIRRTFASLNTDRGRMTGREERREMAIHEWHILCRPVCIPCHLSRLVRLDDESMKEGRGVIGAEGREERSGNKKDKGRRDAERSGTYR
jgi:hypothetical protein